MTKEEALRMLKAKLECLTRNVSGSDADCNRRLCAECHLNYEKGNMREQKEYLRMSIKALEQKPCEDAINRQAVLNKIKEVCFSKEWIQFRVDNGGNGQRDFLISYIKQLPSVSPQSKIAKWITNSNFSDKFICSYCNAKFDMYFWEQNDMNYCPSCGAKLQEERIENDKRTDS